MRKQKYNMHNIDINHFELLTPNNIGIDNNKLIHAALDAQKLLKKKLKSQK